MISDQNQQFITIYRKWLENSKEYLSAKKMAWNSCTAAQREEILAELVRCGLVPDRVTAMIKIFNARVVEL